MSRISAIVLAAGLSSRMESLKPLLDLRGRTLLERAVVAFTSVGIDDVVVVTGHRSEEVGAAAVAAGARPLHNPRFADGMYSSVRAGVADVRPGRRFFLLPVDCPLVRPETVGRLARTGAEEASAVVPAHAGRPGHPPLLAPRLRDAILTSRPAGGLRGLLAGRLAETLTVDVDDPGVTLDVDTPDDLGVLRAMVTGEDLPGESRCLQLLREQGATEELLAHSQAVAAVAVALATALNERDQYLCVPLVVAAALLHDVARARPGHAEAGGDLLDRLGYRRVAPLVRRHVRLGLETGGDLDEAQVVFLADKLVKADRPVRLDERFAPRLARHASDPAVRDAVLARQREAWDVLHRVEAVLGRPLPGASGG